MSSGGVLLSVESKHAGNSWLKAGKVQQAVSVTKPLVLDLTFKFLHHLDEDGVMMTATNKDPAFVDRWMTYLNWILGGAGQCLVRRGERPTRSRSTSSWASR